MRTLKNTIVALVATAVSFSASAMNADFFTKNTKHIESYQLAGSDTIIYDRVDVAPMFQEGVTAFTNYLASNIKYPVADREKKITGKVFISFIVEADGSLSNFNAVRGPSETMKAEAIRVLASSPKWQPGQLGGKAVRVRYTVPINFALN